MTKARQLADLGNAYDDGALSNRNMIINGAMKVAQRGTSITVSNNNWLYLMDRFQFDENGSTSTVLDVTQSTDAPDGFSYSLKMTATTADSTLGSGDGLRLQHKIEAQDLQSLAHGTSEAKPVTLSFWVKSKTTGTNNVWFYKEDSSRQTTFAYTINTADTWEYKTIVIPADTSGIINNDNGSGMMISWYLVAGTNFNSGTRSSSWESLTSANRAVGQVNNFSSTSDYWAVTGVQLEIGDTATPFEHRSYGDELAACQRYFELTGLSPEIFGIAAAWSTAAVFGTWQFQTTKRATPSVGSHLGAVGDHRFRANGNNYVAIGLGLSDATTCNTRFDVSVSGGLTAGWAGWVSTNNGPSQWFADSEI